MRAPGSTYRQKLGGIRGSAFGLAALVAIGPAGLHAQVPSDSTQQHSAPVTLRLGGAYGSAGTSVGGESSSNSGVVITGLVGMRLSARSELALDLAVQPFEAQNPVRDEAYTAVYAMVGVEIGLGAGHRAFVRPELGAAFRSWTGSNVWEESETGAAFGLLLGYGIPAGSSLGVVLEGGVRVSGASELSTVLWTAGVSFVPLGARH